MTSVIVTLAATEIPSYISYEVFLSYIGMGMSDMSLGRLIYQAENAMLTPGWQFEFWSPVAVASIITIVLYVVGQNLGAGNRDRAVSAPKLAMKMGLVVMVVILTPLMIFAPQLVRLFNGDPEVLRFGTWFIRVISPFYLTFAANQVYMGALRGAGNTRSPMFISLGSFVVFRQIYLAVTRALGAGFLAVALAYPMGWIMCSTLLIIRYSRSALVRES